VFKRPDGRFQVALRGEPLYRYAGDASKGEANGEGLQDFGGTWHAVVARTSSGY
jgi:predicted lipoprotein with Yx(FWY)xxD motif